MFVLADDTSPYFVTKTQFAQERFVFVTGFVGARSWSCKKRCERAPANVSRHLTTKGPHGIFVGEKRPNKQIQSARRAFVESLREARTGRRRLVELRSMLYGGAYLQHPDLHVLAVLAEEAGIDLRLEILGDPVWRRLDTGNDVASLADHAACLAQDVATIDRRFIETWRTRVSATASNDPFEARVASMIDVGRGMKSPYFVRKTRFNETSRFVFVAGVEGTGHHAAGSFFEVCEEKRLCVGAKQVVQRLLYDGGVEPTGIFVYQRDTDPSLLLERRAKLIQHFVAMSYGSNLNVINTAPSFKTTGMMSYPNFLGKQRAFDHINLPVLASLAEKAGIDLRVLVLARDPLEILVSTTIHRVFDTRPVQAAVLADNAAVLAAELQLLDPEFFMCVPYDEIGVDDWWNKQIGTYSRASWLHPKLPGDILKAAVAPIYNKRHNKTLVGDDDDVALERLTVAIDHLHRTAKCDLS